MGGWTTGRSSTSTGLCQTIDQTARFHSNIGNQKYSSIRCSSRYLLDKLCVVEIDQCWRPSDLAWWKHNLQPWHLEASSRFRFWSRICPKGSGSGVATRCHCCRWLLCHQTMPWKLSQETSTWAGVASRYWVCSCKTPCQVVVTSSCGLQNLEAFDKEADRSWVGNAAAKLALLLNEAGDQPFEVTTERCFEDDLPVPRGEENVESVRDPFARYDTQIRITPTVFGMIGLGILILNRQSLVFSEMYVPQSIFGANSRVGGEGWCLTHHSPLPSNFESSNCKVKVWCGQNLSRFHTKMTFLSSPVVEFLLCFLWSVTVYLSFPKLWLCMIHLIFTFLLVDLDHFYQSFSPIALWVPKPKDPAQTRADLCAGGFAEGSWGKSLHLQGVWFQRKGYWKDDYILYCHPSIIQKEEWLPNQDYFLHKRREAFPLNHGTVGRVGQHGIHHPVEPIDIDAHLKPPLPRLTPKIPRSVDKYSNGNPRVILFRVSWILSNIIYNDKYIIHPDGCKKTITDLGTSRIQEKILWITHTHTHKRRRLPHRSYTQIRRVFVNHCWSSTQEHQEVDPRN